MADPRHKREPNARPRPTLPRSRSVRIAAGAAVAATVPAVALGVAVAAPQATALLQADTSRGADAARADAARGADAAARLEAAQRGAPVSRSESRTSGRADRAAQQRQVRARATQHAVRSAHQRRWVTTDLNLWTTPTESARQVGLLSSGKRVLVTGRAADGRVELALGGQSRWVTAGYLADQKPVAAVGAAAGLSMAPCPNPSVENGLTSNAVYVYRSVCHAFPQITSYGGWDAHGEHASGRALDIMTSDVTLGNAIAAFLQAHAGELHLYDILWRQRIWTPVRAAEGWRLFADRGSATANHYDHVHVSTY